MMSSVLLLLLFVSAHITTGQNCNQGMNQAIYQLKNSSMFQNLRDLEQGLNLIFQDQLAEIKKSSGVALNKQQFILRDLTPTVSYNQQSESINLAQNSIVQTGGTVNITVSFEYEFKDGLSSGLGRGVAQLEQTVAISINQSETYLNDNLQWAATLSDLNLPDFTFSLDDDQQISDVQRVNFMDLLNHPETNSTFNSLKMQTNTQFALLAALVANLNTNFATNLFPQNYLYMYSGQRIGYDYSLTDYNLSALGELIKLRGVPSDQQNMVCYDIQPFSLKTTYIGVSQSVFQNTLSHLITNNMLDSVLNSTNWNISNFYFTVGDLVWIMPTISQVYKLTQSISGSCENPVSRLGAYNSTLKTYDVFLKFQCSLSSDSDKQKIITFDLDTTFHLKPSFSQLQEVLLKVGSASFTGSNFKSDRFTITKPEFAQYYLNLASQSVEGMSVFGTGLLSLPDFVKLPAWTVSSSGSTFYFYDSINNVDQQEVQEY